MPRQRRHFTPEQRVVTHPAGLAWAGTDGPQLHLVTLEGADGRSPAV
jgi:hypothetical protein